MSVPLPAYTSYSRLNYGLSGEKSFHEMRGMDSLLFRMRYEKCVGLKNLRGKLFSRKLTLSHE